MDPLQSAAGAADSATGTRTPAGPRNAQARWQLELERAQLAQQSRQAAARAAAPATPAEGGVETRARAPGATTQAPAMAQVGRERAAPGRPGAASAAAKAENSAASAAPVKQTQSQPGGGEARIVRDEASRAVALPARPAARPVPVTWPKVNVHARWNGAGVEVWVRDASLDAGARERLASRLRAQLRLERLTVNGETIYSEENTTWRSKQ